MPIANGRDGVVVQYVDSSMAARLLCKFPDNSAFDFDYTKSALWSPPLVRHFHPLPLSKCTPSKTPKMSRKLQFGDDWRLFKKLSLSKVENKIALDLNLSKQKMKFKKKSDESLLSPSATRKVKGWGKALKVKLKQLKKKKDKILLLHFPC
ncbi:hypothetical protein Dimus_017049 [Dionaea muscipula]